MVALETPQHVPSRSMPHSVKATGKLVYDVVQLQTDPDTLGWGVGWGGSGGLVGAQVWHAGGTIVRNFARMRNASLIAHVASRRTVSASK